MEIIASRTVRADVADDRLQRRARDGELSPSRSSQHPERELGGHGRQAPLDRGGPPFLVADDDAGDRAAGEVTDNAGHGLLGTSAGQRDLGLSDAMFDAIAASILTTAPATPDTSPGTVAIAFATMVSDLPALTDAERTLLAEWLARAIAHLQKR